MQLRLLSSPCLLLLALSFATPAPGLAQALDYPARPVRAIVPFPPGGGTDIGARVVSQKLTQGWGKQVVIDNRAGANGSIGTEIVANAVPDGYTFLFGTSGPMAINPTLYGKSPYDPIKDFTPVVMVAPTYFVLVTHPSVPAATVGEFLQLGRSPSNKLILASSGIGSPGHLSGEMLKMMARTNFLHVPYKGGGPALAAVLAGEASFVFTDVIAGMGYVNAGRLKLLAAATPKRIAKLPNIPTLAESGVPGYDALSWTAIFVPAKTPAPIVRKINVDVKEVLKLPDVQEHLVSDASDFAENSPEYAAAFLKKEVAKWGKVIRESGAKPE